MIGVGLGLRSRGNMKKFAELLDKFSDNQQIMILGQLLSAISLSLGWNDPLTIGISSVGVVGATILSGLQLFRFNKTNYFFEDIVKQNKVLTDEMLDEPFIHRFYITYNAILRTGYRKKIEFLARLFTDSYDNDTLKDNDEYEILLDTINNLKEKHINFLTAFEKSEIKFSIIEYQNAYNNADNVTVRNFTQVYNIIRKKYDIENYDLFIIERLGLIQLYYQPIKNLTYFNGYFEYTKLYDKIKKYVIDESTRCA